MKNQIKHQTTPPQHDLRYVIAARSVKKFSIVQSPAAATIPAAMADQLDPHRYRTQAPRPPEGPLDLENLLLGEGDVEIEIGFGHGLFLFERGAARRDVRLVGLEVKKKWSVLVAERVARRGLSNVTVWGMDAKQVLPRVKSASIARVFMHFPDPWWKRKHEKRRLTGDTLLDEIARLLRPGGELFMQTDVEDRAIVHLQAIREHAAYQPGGVEGYLDHNPYQGRSNREARAAEDGLPVWRTLAIKR